ncbi:MAG TPA: hypothetical protein VGA30_03325, partial [Actinomycetota bacterium]
VRTRIRERAEGIPLYAVETVRMLLDRGLLKQEGSRYVVTGPVDELAVPESLQALIAARLDGLPKEERALLQDGAVLGKTFTPAGVAAVTGRAEGDLLPLLASLVRKEILGVQADPRSPDRGQYGFLQALVRKVAYDMLSKRDRKAKHLAVAAHLESSWGPEDEEIVQIVAAHYLDAYRSAPGDPDAPEVRSKAREALIRAARRAQSLAAHEESFLYFDRAIDVTEDPVEQARVLEEAGFEASVAGRIDEAFDRYRRAIELFEANGLTHPAARVSGRMGLLEWWQLGEIERAAERMERSFQVLSKEEPDADVATLASDLGRLYFFLGRRDLALERLEFALPLAEGLVLPEVLSQALNTKALTFMAVDRHQEATALLEKSLKVALAHDKFQAAARAYTNLSVMAGEMDRYEEALSYERAGVALARRFGDRGNEWFLLAHQANMHWMLGRWDDALEVAGEIPDPKEAADAKNAARIAGWTVRLLLIERGEVEEALAGRELFVELEGAAGVQEMTLFAGIRAAEARASGRHGETLDLARDGLYQAAASLSLAHPNMRFLITEGVNAALALQDRVALDDLLGRVEGRPPGAMPPFLRGLAARARARIGWWDGDAEGGDRASAAAEALFRQISNPFWLGVTLLERAESLAGRGEDAEGPLSEAREIFDGLGAKPWLERVAAVGSPGIKAEVEAAR